MNNRLSFIKTTVVGGLVFLIPAVIVVVVLGKVIGALRVLATALAPLFGIKSFAGGVMLDLSHSLSPCCFVLLRDCWPEELARGA
jgi:hypothetical protein